ncbi:MAG: universal stress protein [Chitinophagales bacterium]
MNKILVPSDFSENAVNAFKYALHIAAKQDATITTFHVYSLSISSLEMGTPPELMQSILENQETREEEHYKEFTAKLHKEATAENLTQVVVNHKLTEGLVVDEIVQEAKDAAPDLIVLGTDGVDNLVDKLFGTTTSNVIEEVECAVLTVPADAKFNGIHRIAYASDFNKADVETLKEILAFAALFNATVHVVHVSEEGAPTDEDQRRMEELEEQFIKNEEAGKIVFDLIRADEVLEGLSKYLEAEAIDMLVMFKEKESFWERMFSPSLTKKIALYGKKPLLVLKKKFEID